MDIITELFNYTNPHKYGNVNFLILCNVLLTYQPYIVLNHDSFRKKFIYFKHYNQTELNTIVTLF